MLDTALKEWAVVCELMLEGRLALMLRKGGIQEDAGPGAFRLQHSRFLFYPSWAHQKPEMLKPAYHERVEILEEPAEITFHGLGEVAKIWEVPDRAAIDAIDDLLCWSEPYLQMRFNYRPENPLFLVAVRAMRLAEPKTIENLLEYGGCRSWVPLEPQDAVDDRGAEPVVDDATFTGMLARVDAAMKR